MNKYRFFRRMDNQASSAPQEISLEAEDNRQALETVIQTLGEEGVLLDAYGKFMLDLFKQFYSVSVTKGTTVITYNNLIDFTRNLHL
jgi:hypothetical protein